MTSYKQEKAMRACPVIIVALLVIIVLQPFVEKSFGQDTLFSFPAPGTFPTGLAWDGKNFWNADFDLRTIYKLSPTGTILKSFPAPSGAPAGLLWDGSSLWLVDEPLGRVFVLDTNGTVLRSFGLPDSAAGDPSSWGLAWDGTYLWHCQYEIQARVFKMDPQTGDVLFSFVPPTELILDIAWFDGFLYGVDLYPRRLYKIDPNTGTVVGDEPWPVPYPLGLTWDGSFFWNVSGPGLGTGRIYKVSSSLVTSASEGSMELPTGSLLSQNYPNPFNPTTTFSFIIPQTSIVSLKVYDILGREVTTLVNERKVPGTYEVTWDARLPYSNLSGGQATSRASGVYLYRLSVTQEASGDRVPIHQGPQAFVQTRRLMILR